MKNYIWGVLRLALGWIFLWAFLDKVFGLGFATQAGKGWIDGGSPTSGFLAFGTKGPFAEFFQGLAGVPLVDWLFMLGLLFVGASLLLGIFVRLASLTGITMLLFIYTASAILPEHNPFLDDHIIYAIILAGLMTTPSGRYLGLGGLWEKLPLVRNMRILR
ncbi:MAG: DoxX family membrane protein [Candidatus Yanofskybacteria bacterium]|nr:DoxX family membrane protein [Candidatus Yanofskybacteria bacterium]